MIYTPQTFRGRLFVDGVEIKHCFYVDRRRRVARVFRSYPSGALMVDHTGKDVVRDELYWGHRQQVVFEGTQKRRSRERTRTARMLRYWKKNKSFSQEEAYKF